MEFEYISDYQKDRNTYRDKMIRRVLESRGIEIEGRADVYNAYEYTEDGRIAMKGMCLVTDSQELIWIMLER